MMKTLDLTSADGTSLRGCLWEPDGEVVFDLVLVHGLGEHIARYDTMATQLNTRGIRVRGVDFRGHGKSGGKQGFVEQWSDYHEDIEAVARDVPGPFALYGHSMGSIVALDWLRHHEDRVFAAGISGSPIEVAAPVPAWKTGAAGLLSKLWPSLQMDNELDSAMLATDPAVAESYDKDPLVHSWATPRWLTEFNGARARIKEHAARYATPLLATWGSEDPIISGPALQAFVDSWKAPTLALPRAGMRHEVHNEPEHPAYTTEIADWFMARHEEG